jgi:hypothetical protein
MVKWTSVLAFVVACCVGVTAFCADTPKKERPKMPTVGEMFKAIAGENKTFTADDYAKSPSGKRAEAREAGAAAKAFAAMGPVEGKVDLAAFTKWWEARVKERGGRRGGGKPGG